ncbi:MAG: hydroxyacid-oxoacid transhydrogenase [Thermoleophilia bacterium]
MNETVFTVEATPIVYGPGASDETGFHLARLGVKRVLVVSDPWVSGLGITQRVRDAIGERDIATELYTQARVEPNEDSAREVIEIARSGGYDGFVGVGGGSSLDTAKLAALFASHGGELLDYVNKPIGKGIQIPGPLLPLVAVPTTAGTGSEATSVAILDFPSLGVKTGISHRYLRPRVGIVDPLLLRQTPSQVTASCGLDVVCHAVESFTARPFDSRPKTSPDERPPYQGSNPVADVWSSRAIEFGGKYLRRAVRDADDLEARGQMMLGATLAGIGFGNAGVHVPHACAYPIASLKHEWTPTGYPTSHAFVPHGFSVTVTAPACFRFTQEATPERHREAARLLTGGETEDLGEAFASLMQDVGAPMTISELGYTEADIPALVDGAMKQQRLLVISPREVQPADLERIFRESL